MIPDNQISDWSVRRSGAHLTITGINTHTAEDVRVTGVEEISAAKRQGSNMVATAITADGSVWELMRSSA